MKTGIPGKRLPSFALTSDRREVTP